MYTSVLAYGTDKFLSCDNLVAVIGAGAGMSQVGMYVNLVMQNLEKQAGINERYLYMMF